MVQFKVFESPIIDFGVHEIPTFHVFSCASTTSVTARAHGGEPSLGANVARARATWLRAGVRTRSSLHKLRIVPIGLAGQVGLVSARVAGQRSHAMWLPLVLCVLARLPVPSAATEAAHGTYVLARTHALIAAGCVLPGALPRVASRRAKQCGSAPAHDAFCCHRACRGCVATDPAGVQPELPGQLPRLHHGLPRHS